jgi:hypothetical protein
MSFSDIERQHSFNWSNGRVINRQTDKRRHSLLDVEVLADVLWSAELERTRSPLPLRASLFDVLHPFRNISFFDRAFWTVATS